MNPISNTIQGNPGSKELFWEFTRDLLNQLIGDLGPRGMACPCDRSVLPIHLCKSAMDALKLLPIGLDSARQIGLLLDESAQLSVQAVAQIGPGCINFSSDCIPVAIVMDALHLARNGG